MSMTDEQVNKLVDVIAANESLTADEMEALTALRDDIYERMTYEKDNESYKEKYEDMERKYRERWRDEVLGDRKEEEVEEKEEISYEDLYGGDE